MASLRATRIVYVNNANSGTIALPAGSATGDTCYLFAESGYAVSTPAGWTAVDIAGGTNVNGAVFKRTLTADDITTGSVTVSFTGAYYGIIAAATFIGAAVQRTIVSSRNSFNGSSRVLTTDASPIVGDYVLYFGAGRFNGIVTSSSGSVLETASNPNASAVLAGEVLASAGAVTNTFSFSAFTSGDYDVILVIGEEIPGSKITKADFSAVLRQEPGAKVTKAGFAVVMRQRMRHEMTKFDAVVVMRSPTTATRRRALFLT